MNDNAPQSKSSVGTLLIAIIMLAVGFAAGHIVSDMNLIGGTPKLPEAKQGSGATRSTPREGAPTHEAIDNAVEDAASEAEGAVNDATEKAEEIVDDAKNKLDDATGG